MYFIIDYKDNRGQDNEEKNLSENIGKGKWIVYSRAVETIVFENINWACWMPFCVMEEIRTFEIRKNLKVEIEEREG